jgi:DNA-binding NtrC family response regulator
MSGSGQERGGFSVLVVDDEADFLEALVPRLRVRGLDAEGLLTGEDALSALAERRREVVLLDVRLPGLSGPEVLERIKAQWPEVEVVILTGYADTETAVRVMELGAFDYLVKPIAIDKLVYRLQDAHERARLRSGASPSASEKGPSVQEPRT